IQIVILLAIDGQDEKSHGDREGEAPAEPESPEIAESSRLGRSLALPNSRIRNLNINQADDSRLPGPGHHDAIQDPEHKRACEGEDHALPVEARDVPSEERVAQGAADRGADDADDGCNGQSLEASRPTGVSPGHDELRDGPRDEAEETPQQEVGDHDWSSP